MIKKCLFCENDFDAKRESAKYCSDNCRVKWNYKFGKKKGVTDLQMQVLYNAMLEMVSKNKGVSISREQIETKISETITDDLPWDKPKHKIVRSQQYFEKQIMNGFDTPEEHRIFIEQLYESDLPSKMKTDFALASRTKQT